MSKTIEGQEAEKRPDLLDMVTRFYEGVFHEGQIGAHVENL